MKISKRIKITRLDKRYSGYRQFRFSVEFIRGYMPNNDRLRTFLLVRDWCHDTWGHTCERDLHVELSEDISKGEIEYSVNPAWSWYWHPNESNYRIYLKDQEELNIFAMRWLG